MALPQERKADRELSQGLVNRVRESRIGRPHSARLPPHGGFGTSNAWAFRVQRPWRWSATARNRSIDGTRSPTKGCSRKAHRSSLLSMRSRRPQRRSGPSVSLRTLERERQRFEAAPNSWTLWLDRFGFMVVDFLKIFSGTRVCGAQSRKVHCMGQAACGGTREMSLFPLSACHLSQPWIAVSRLPA
jgi:hypothetical protein